jgi:hypothetical protein
MISRCGFLSAVLIPACLALGCYAPSEPPTAAEAPAAEQKKGAKLPQAPPPHAKKTTAELLVGKWKVVSVEGKPLPKTYETTLELTPEGGATFRVVKSRSAVVPPPRVGDYRVDGNVVRFAVEPTSETPRQSWSVTIKVLDENRMVISASDKDKGTEFVRIKDQ